MSREILYIGTIVNSKIEDEYNLEYYSRAGNNKKRGILESLESCGASTTVISPVFVNNNDLAYHGQRAIRDDDLKTDLQVPAIIDIYGLNYLFLALTTTLLTLNILYKEDYDAILFYDFQLETAIPALIGSRVFSAEMILEYEDGLFLHDNRVIRWTSMILRPVCGKFVDGAACVNQPLADLIPTDNTTIVRGFPSIGMPDELPEPKFEREETVVMFAGRFDEVRGIDTFLDIAPELELEQEVVFWVSGYGPDSELDRIQSRIEKMDDSRFSYFGTLPWEEYRNKIVSADIVVNFQDPNHKISEYTFPSKLLDFMSAGKIIVSTKMSDLDQHFSDKIVVDGRSNQQLKETLQNTIESQSSPQIEERQERSRQWIETECSHTRVGEKILKLVDPR